MGIPNHDRFSRAFVLKQAKHGVFVSSLGVLFGLVVKPVTDFSKVNQLIVNQHPHQRLECDRNRVLLCDSSYRLLSKRQSLAVQHVEAKLKLQLLIVEVIDVIDFLQTDNACLTVPDLADD